MRHWIGYTSLLGASIPFFVAPCIVYAADYVLLAPINSFTSVPTNDFAGYAQTIITLIIGVSAVLAVIMIMVGGLMWIGGEAVRTKSQGISFIKHAVGGLVLLLASYLILNTINPQLLNLSLNLPQLVQNTTGPGAGGTPNSPALPSNQPTTYCFSGMNGGCFNGPNAQALCEAQRNATEAQGGSVSAQCGSTRPSELAPSAQKVTSAMAPYQQMIAAAAQKYNIDPLLLESLLYQESTGNPNAVSQSGAIGLGQLLPGTASQLGYTGTLNGLMDPATNIDLAAHYLANQLALTNGNVDYALAAYNGGAGNQNLPYNATTNPGALTMSNSCPGLKAYQCVYDSSGCYNTSNTNCTLNTGFAQTRTYVTRINAIKTSITP